MNEKSVSLSKVYRIYSLVLVKQLKFIFGWRLTIKAISILFKTLQAKGYKFLLTRNLNQDCLENFFGQIRACCEHVKNPTPIQFSPAFKKMFIMKPSNF